MLPMLSVNIKFCGWGEIVSGNFSLAKNLVIRIYLLRLGVLVWTSRLNKFIRIYGLKFPLDDHITLIRNARHTFCVSVFSIRKCIKSMYDY